ncbi:MAG: DUF4738 domain-containing protein [Prevotella sp.]|jgi:hypothetical protein
MRLKLIYVLTTSLSLVLLSSCRHKEPVKQQQQAPKEDLEAKKLMQGIWMNSEDETVVFKAQGDTLYYPDSTSQPVSFQIFHDTLVLHAANTARYKIVRQSAHVFEFRNASGDLVSLVKSENSEDNEYFSKQHPTPLNTGKLIKRDSVLIYGNDRFHSYVQINPTTYKVVKANYSDEGVEVDNVYYDNIIHVSLYRGNYCLFSRDFRKQDFAGVAPRDFIKQGILNDIQLMGMDPRGTHFQVSIVIPDSPSSFLIDLLIDYRGRMHTTVKN